MISEKWILKGNILYVQINLGWWQGVGPEGTYGLFPSNYVEIIDN